MSTVYVGSSDVLASSCLHRRSLVENNFSFTLWTCDKVENDTRVQPLIPPSVFTRIKIKLYDSQVFIYTFWFRIYVVEDVHDSRFSKRSFWYHIFFPTCYMYFAIHVMPYNKTVHGMDSTSQARLIEKLNNNVKLYFRKKSIFVNKIIWAKRCKQYGNI